MLLFLFCHLRVPGGFSYRSQTLLKFVSTFSHLSLGQPSNDSVGELAHWHIHLRIFTARAFLLFFFSHFLGHCIFLSFCNFPQSNQSLLFLSFLCDTICFFSFFLFPFRFFSKCCVKNNSARHRLQARSSIRQTRTGCLTHSRATNPPSGMMVRLRCSAAVIQVPDLTFNSRSARSRQVRTPENLDYEVTLPPIKPKPVGIFALGGDLEDSPPELGSLFRQSHERILALQRENTVRSSTVPHDVTLLNQSGSADFQDTMVSSGAPASLFQVSDDGCYQPDIDSWCSRFSDHNPFQELPVRRGRFIQTPNGEATEKWPELNSCLQLPERHCETSENGFQMTATEPVQYVLYHTHTVIMIPINKHKRSSSDANGDGNHRCTEPRYGGNFGCADIRVRIVHDASFHSGPHFFPARFQGIIDLQVCDQSMAKHMPGWKGISNERCSLPSEPIYIYVTSDLDTVKNAAKWLFNQIHYTNTGITAYSLDMRTLSSVVELSSQFGGGGSRVDACIRWALLTAEVASLEDTLFGLHVSTRSNNSDLFVMFKNFLALNFTGEDMSSCTKMISTVAPYLPHVLFQALCK